MTIVITTRAITTGVTITGVTITGDIIKTADMIMDMDFLDIITTAIEVKISMVVMDILDFINLMEITTQDFIIIGISLEAAIKQMIEMLTYILLNEFLCIIFSSGKEKNFKFGYYKRLL